MMLLGALERLLFRFGWWLPPPVWAELTGRFHDSSQGVDGQEVETEGKRGETVISESFHRDPCRAAGGSCSRLEPRSVVRNAS